MNLLDIFFISLGLSADAFAVAISLGLAMTKSWTKAVVVGLYFGVFQAGMPIVGYLMATWFSGQVSVYGDFIAFALLCLIGGKMITGSFKGQPQKGQPQMLREASVLPVYMLPLALATSIDAMAIGVSFAFLQVAIISAAVFIGVTTFVLSAIGVRIGNAFGARHQSKANIIGGAILILIGIRILIV